MKKVNPLIVFVIISLLFLPGCGIITAIFQAGFWTAIILVVLVVTLIGWGVYSFTKKSNGSEDI